MCVNIFNSWEKPCYLVGVGITRALTIRCHHDTYVTIKYYCDFKNIATFCDISQCITSFPTSIFFPNFKWCPQKETLSTSVLSKKKDTFLCLFISLQLYFCKMGLSSRQTDQHIDNNRSILGVCVSIQYCHGKYHNTMLYQFVFPTPTI